mmetsp:Transcript_79752/g.201573  ORF Transcript_79752/g.201573 Transcript_79752/m.201573 type:complete len:214 (-) Transcript_79752:37-678(-)
MWAFERVAILLGLRPVGIEGLSPPKEAPADTNVEVSDERASDPQFHERQLSDTHKSLRQFETWMVAEGWTASTAATYTCTLRRLMRNGTLCSTHCAAEAQPRDRAALRAWRQFCEHQPSNDDSQRCALRACGELKWRQYNDDNQPCGQSALAASADSHSSIESDDAAQHQKRKRRRVVPTMIDDSGQVVSFTDSMREQVRTLCGARLVPQDPA